MRITTSKVRSKVCNVAGKDAQQGLSLIELLISMIILAALMAGISELIVTNTRNASATSNLARLQETGRTAMQIVTGDIRRAGYLGGNVFPETITGTIGTAAPVAACDANTAWARMLQQPVFGINDAKTGYTCIDTGDGYLRGDILTVRYTPTPALTDAEMTDAATGDDATPNKLFLRATLMAGRLFKGSEQGDSANELDPITSRNYAIAANAYFVGDSGRSCGRTEAGSELEIPALFRKTLNDAGLPVTQELLAGVEHIQFRYKVGNRYLDANDVNLLEDWDPGTVTAIETSVLVRAECPEAGFQNNRTFDFGDIENYGPEDAFRRQIFTSVTQLRNQ